MSQSDLFCGRRDLPNERFLNSNWGCDRATQGNIDLDRDTLNQITSERPIWSISWARHFYYLNDAALKSAGADREEFA